MKIAHKIETYTSDGEPVLRIYCDEFFRSLYGIHELGGSLDYSFST